MSDVAARTPSVGMVGRTISHYRILRELGGGGMGVVFAADDVRLGREVAIKFVPDTTADDRQLFERLRSEARTASALNHPNICIVHDIGEHNGRPFVVMELLQGQTLRDRLAQSRLTVLETLDMGIQVADALDAAHCKHIIHRDIKPANLFLTARGTVKILDFGLAKVVSHQPSALTVAATSLTTPGIALGTVSYMSPEQASGGDLDGRSDLFSFGVVLYECVTGHQPFKGKAVAMVLAEILTRSPAPPLVLNPDLPLRLQEIITNCLEKDRELRYQDAAELRTDLKRLKRDVESASRNAFETKVSIDSALVAVSAMTAPALASAQVPPASAYTVLPAQRGHGAVVGAIVVTALVLILVALYMFRLSNVSRQVDVPASIERSMPTTTGSAAEDDAAIRRVVAAYARTINSKDLDALRSLRPSLSGEEQRRLEESFKAMSSQRVEITVVSIEHRASNTLVTVRRRDTVTAGGRAQALDHQQTMTLIRSGAGWIISEVGS